ncbi:MAG: hypothetical protein ACRECW_12130 [Phyllobacterium sp.]
MSVAKAKLRKQSASPIVVLCLMAMSGCVSTPPPPAPEAMSRVALQTAPADLQLLCASAAAEPSGVASDKILPVNSRRLDSGDYQVDLNAAGATKTCIIDAQGNVKSVQ